MSDNEYEGSGGLNLDDLIIRRSELDDAHTINEIISVEENSALDTLYNYPKVLRLIETSCLSVTVLDKNENILGCLVFDSSHEIITGMNDFMHENLWEDWLYSVFQVDEDFVITPYNSLWLKYAFIGKGVESMTDEIEINIIKKIFRYVYNSMPELEMVLYHYRKEASSSRSASEYISPLLTSTFFELKKKDLSEHAKENINLSSRIFVSMRNEIIDQLEIREALEQDHDDLVEICNSQSELYTEVYGDYFIAELIANQNENRKAIVAQVGSKAKGLLSLSTDIDYSFLAKNYELEIYDNLCSTEFMDAIRYKRTEASIEDQIQKEFERRNFETKMHDFKILCSDVGNRIMLQQYCISHQNEIKKFLEDALADSTHKMIPKKASEMEEQINNWLRDFKITQPDSFFDKYPTTDVELYGHIINEKDLFLDTLTYFGLPQGYIEGKGQWKDYWAKEAEKQRDNERLKNMVKGGHRDRGGRGRSKNDSKQQKKENPNYFDLQPFLDSFKNFVDCGPEIRTRIRVQLEEEQKKITQLFCFPNGEPNPKKKQDILSIVDHLGNNDLQPNQVEGFGWVLECFGRCNYETEVIEVAEKPKEESSEFKALRFKSKATDKKENLVKKTIKLASFEEFRAAVDKVAELDETLVRLQKIQSDTLKKVVAEKDSSKEKEINRSIAEKRALAGSTNNQYVERYKGKSEEEILRDIPDEAKNAVAINIFFIDKLFESRSIDFLPFAFEMFPQFEYIILTQPFRVEESVLLQSFIPIQKRENTNISHTLYIYHRACLMSPYLSVRKSIISDVDEGMYLIQDGSNEEEFKRDLTHAITNNASDKISFTACNQNAVIGFFVMTKDVNLEYYKSHFCIQYHLLLDQYALTDHSRLLHSVINPLFQRCRRFLFREILRLSNKKTLLFEVELGYSDHRQASNSTRLLLRDDSCGKENIPSLP